MATGIVRLLLRIEGGAVLLVCVGLYFALGGNAWLLVPLVLLVDVSMVGYLISPRLGAMTYNALHNWAPGALLIGLGTWTRSDAITLAGAILAAHVGMDRLAGYGLKYPTSFVETHLGWIGRSARPFRR